MRLEDINWMDVEKYLEKDDRLILVWGACEQHGYLSLLTDVKIPLALADAAAKQTGALVGPPLNFGASPYFEAYPGSISIRSATLLAFTEDVVRSAYRQGFRRIMFLNGHGGNAAARTLLYELANALPGLRAVWYSWWQAPSVRTIAENHSLEPGHGNWLEAFPFTKVADLPKKSKLFPKESVIADADHVRQVFGDGSFGGQYEADDAVMDEIFDAALKDILNLLRFE